MIDAEEIRKEYNQKTPYQQVMEDIGYCIKLAASRGEREIKYRWPTKYLLSGPLYDQVKMDLEIYHHFTVFDGNSGNLWDDNTLYISW